MRNGGLPLFSLYCPLKFSWKVYRVWDSIVLQGILGRNWVCQDQHPQSSLNWMTLSRAHVPSFLWLWLDDGLVAILIFLTLGCGPFLLHPFGFRKQTNPALHTFHRGQANGMNCKTSRWLTSFPRWSRYQRLTFRWAGQHGVDGVRGPLEEWGCVKAQSGIELKS